MKKTIFYIMILFGMFPVSASAATCTSNAIESGKNILIGWGKVEKLRASVVTAIQTQQNLQINQLTLMEKTIKDSVDSSGTQLSQNIRALAKSIEQIADAQIKTEGSQKEMLSSAIKDRKNINKLREVNAKLKCCTPKDIFAEKYADEKIIKSAITNQQQNKVFNENIRKDPKAVIGGLSQQIKAGGFPSNSGNDITSLKSLNKEEANAVNLYIEGITTPADVKTLLKQTSLLNENDLVAKNQLLERHNVAKTVLQDMAAMRHASDIDENKTGYSKIENLSKRVSRKSKDTKWGVNNIAGNTHHNLVELNRTFASIENILFEILKSGEKENVLMSMLLTKDQKRKDK